MPNKRNVGYVKGKLILVYQNLYQNHTGTGVLAGFWGSTLGWCIWWIIDHLYRCIQHTSRPFLSIISTRLAIAFPYFKRGLVVHLGDFF